MKGKEWSRAAKEANTTELLYADDTMLIESSARPINKLLATVVKQSSQASANAGQRFFLNSSDAQGHPRAPPGAPL